MSLLLGLSAAPSPVLAQESPWNLVQDSLITIELGEVIVISSPIKGLEHRAQSNPLATLDHYLEDSQKVSMVKRGAYAWEPLLNDMGSERLSITIDGMKIFGACTDRMDPITAYVDVSNLSQVLIESGQQGSKHGNTIGGALDMRLEKSGFLPLGWTGSVETAFESNNSARTIAGELNHSTERFYVDTDLIYRKAENYHAGGGEEVAYSQFEKFNLSANAGYSPGTGKKLLASFIFDDARDVGYPALPMDVSLARAFIGSLAWEQSDIGGGFEHWEVKGYANTVEHRMDDGQRPDVPIRMDMPGQSDTYGFYSQIRYAKGSHRLLGKVDGHYNRSYAEMTMYPANPGEAEMFMLTWPDVRTLATGVYLEDDIDLGGGNVTVSTRLGLQTFQVADEFGLGSLRIFHPGMEKAQQRFLVSGSGHYHRAFGKLHLTGGLAYGERAPSVSEGFGFYLFNSFDNHDYIGDPDLENEKALEGNLKLGLALGKIDLGLEGHYFHIRDYIIGEPAPGLGVMTIGADGVKRYENLDHATLYNVSLDVRYEILPQLQWEGRVSHHRGRDHRDRNLPFISPLAYRTRLDWSLGDFSASVSLSGAGEQRHFSAAFGEDATPAHTLVSLSMGHRFTFSGDSLLIKTGVENLFDRRYSTHADWNNIERMGRNVHLSLSYAFQ